MLYRLKSTKTEEFLNELPSNSRVFAVIGHNPFEAVFNYAHTNIVSIIVDGKEYKPDYFAEQWTYIINANEMHCFEQIHLDDIVYACKERGIDFNEMMKDVAIGRKEAIERIASLEREIAEIRQQYKI